MPLWNQIWTQDPSSTPIKIISQFHDSSIILIIIIITLVAFSIIKMLILKSTSRFIIDAQNLETIWTIIPTLMLITLAIPSLNILYIIEEINNPTLSIKVIGNQWYWTYEYSNNNNSSFDAFIISPQPKETTLRLLETDNHLLIPNNTETRLLISANDVIHSWTIPSIGVKADAIPGRINQVSLKPLISGVFFGQCSEICGANHSFIPISIEIAPLNIFKHWWTNWKVN